MDWLKRTDWPIDLQQFIEEFACSPIAIDSRSIDSQRLTALAKSHTQTSQNVATFSAALYLVANDLDASHELSQGIHSQTGSYLHGIMHRREKDFSNAKYWFYQAGSMDCFKQLPGDLKADTKAWLAINTNGADWSFDPIQLTDWHAAIIKKSNRGHSDDQFISAVEDIAWQEWRWITNSVVKSRQ